MSELKTVKWPKNLIIALVVYSVFVSFLLGGALIGSIGILAVYLLRVLALLYPFYIAMRPDNARIDINGWLNGGILASLIPEAYLVITAIFVSASSCANNNGLNCLSAALGVMLLVIFSCACQLAGMLIGGILLKRKKEQ
jgi:hypothetical protein